MRVEPKCWINVQLAVMGNLLLGLQVAGDRDKLLEVLERLKMPHYITATTAATTTIITTTTTTTTATATATRALGVQN